eukprot:1158255-Prorocentrum_minimum.AAC.1
MVVAKRQQKQLEYKNYINPDLCTALLARPRRKTNRANVYSSSSHGLRNAACIPSSVNDSLLATLSKVRAVSVANDRIPSSVKWRRPPKSRVVRPTSVDNALTLSLKRGLSSIGSATASNTASSPVNPASAKESVRRFVSVENARRSSTSPHVRCVQSSFSSVRPVKAESGANVRSLESVSSSMAPCGSSVSHILSLRRDGNSTSALSPLESSSGQQSKLSDFKLAKGAAAIALSVPPSAFVPPKLSVTR